MNSLFKLKFKMHKLVNIIFYLIIFVLGFSLGITIKNVHAEELQSQYTYTICRDSVNLFNINGNVNISGGGGGQTDYNIVSGNILTSNVNTAYEHNVGQKFTNLKGKTFTVSAKIISLGTGTDGYTAIYDNYKLVKGLSVQVGQTVKLTYTATSNNIVVGFATASGLGAQFTDIQVELGEEATKYEPYGEQICELTTPGDNMFYDISKNIVGNLNSKDFWVYDIVTCFLAISGITILSVVILSIFKFFVRG